MTTTMIVIARHTAGNPNTLLVPDWASIIKITPEAEGVTTFWLKFH